MRYLVAGLLWLSGAAGAAAYDIVALQYSPDGTFRYRAACSGGYAFEVRYDPARETYRLTLGEQFATFDLAAERACGRGQRTVPSDYMIAGSPAEP